MFLLRNCQDLYFQFSFLNPYFVHVSLFNFQCPFLPPALADSLYSISLPYEHIIILANTDTYGGGGIYNSYTLTTAHHPSFKPVVVHEFGHSFGGLADEYFYSDAPSPLYPYDKEPWEQNISTLVDFESKWKDMVPTGTPIPTPVKKNADEI